MENVKMKLKAVLTDKEFYIFSIITIVFFGAFCIIQYAPDTYSVFANELKQNVKHFFSAGRFVIAGAIYVFMGIFKLKPEGTYLLSYLFAMICTIISLYRLNKFIKKDIKKDNVSILITTLIIINPFSIELFMYIEKGIMMLSVLLCVLAIEQIDKFFNGNKKAILLALLNMLIANCCYQGTVGLFVALSLIPILKYSKNTKEFVGNNVVVAITYGIPALINFLSVKFIFGNARVKGEMILSESLVKIVKGTQNMLLDTYDLLPNYLFALAIIIVLGLIIYKAIPQKKMAIVGVFYLMIVTWLATVAPQILQATDAIWFVARSSYPMAAILGILLWYLHKEFEIKAIMTNSLLIAFILFLLMQFFCFMRYTTDNYKGNYMDKAISLEINEMIKEQEEKTGKTVDSIAIYRDAERQYAYLGLKASGDINVKAYASDWCIVKVLKLYTNHELKVVESDPSREETFSQKNWDYFSKEQVIFEDNVMHLCVF